MKKFLALGLAAIMTLSMAGCGSSETTSSDVPEGGAKVATGDASTETTQDTAKAETASGDKRIINIGTWWIQYYDSSHESVEDDPSYSGLDIAHMKFDNVATIEDRYNCEFYWKNLTYQGV